MSDVLFQTRAGSATLAAAERARAATLVDDLAIGLLGPHRPAVARRLTGMTHPDHFLRSVPADTPAWLEGFRAAFTSHVDTGLLQVDGRTVETFPLALNSTVLVGNDVIRLLAWLHAESEARGYVEPPHRTWLARIVDDGLTTGLLRRSAGWDAVTGLLRAEGGGPVLVSLAGPGTGEEAEAAPWEGQAAQGRTGGAATPPDFAGTVTALRHDPAVQPLDPQSIGRPYGHGLTVLDLIAPDWHERLGRLRGTAPVG